MPRENILFIDDESVICNASYLILKRAGYKVTTASNGEEGFQKLKTETFDLVMTDINMPKMDGISLIKKIRREISTDLPIVVITGHKVIDIAIESMKHGTQGFVTKPFTPQELTGAVEDALRKSGIIRENIRLKAILPLFEVNKRLLSEFNIERLFEIIVEETSRHTGAERASLMLMEDDGHLTRKAFIGNYGEPVRIRLGEGIAGLTAKKREPILLDERIELDPTLKEMMKNPEIMSALSVPIISKGKLLGVLNLAKLKETEPFSMSDMDMVAILCGQVGIAIENARLYENIESSYIGIIATLASTIEARDPYTAGHAIRMAEFSRSIAAELGISGRKMETIYRAALLHDIGKIGIPDHILLKNDKLTDEEFQIMKEHPEIGGKILDNMEGFSEVAFIVRHHHDRFDGNGYPRGLKGEEIPIGARIIALADAFEAMTSDRPYRKALPVTYAVEELKRMADIQFDPAIVDIFLKILKKQIAA